MHELTVTESLLELALRHAKTNDTKRINDLYLVIGQLSSIVDDSVQFYWDIIAKNTLAEGARLHFRRVPTELLCLDCNHQYAPAKEDMACPVCNSIRVKILSGNEFRLEAMDVET
jgi:hydrogenase nickel incorporation protein HypA/HybF